MKISIVQKKNEESGRIKDKNNEDKVEIKEKAMKGNASSKELCYSMARTSLIMKYEI